MHYRNWVYTFFKLMGYIIPFNFMKYFYSKVIPKSTILTQMRDNTSEELPAYIYSEEWMLVMTKELAQKYDTKAKMKKLEELKQQKAKLEGDDSEYFG